MYSVHTRATAMSQAIHCNIAVLCPGLCPGQSPPVLLVCTKEIFNRSHTYLVQHWYILIYSTVPPCTALYWYILPCTMVHDPSGFGFSIWYFVRRELHSANCCAALDVRLSWPCPPAIFKPENRTRRAHDGVEVGLSWTRFSSSFGYITNN